MMPLRVLVVSALVLLCACAGKHAAPEAESASPVQHVAKIPADGSSPAQPDEAALVSSAGQGINDSTDDFSLDDYDDDSPALEVFDPFEPWNRFWFRFNDALLLKVIKPVHEGYSKVVPSTIRNGISNFAHNLAAPLRFLNSILQGKFTQAGVEFGRFFINTVTSFGLADVASQSKPLYPYHPETANLGHTLAVWGIGEGPYLVWPFFGPSTARDTIGMIGEAFAAPQNYLLSWQAHLASSTGLKFNDMDKTYTPYEQVIAASLEPYIAVRNGYLLLLRRVPK